MLPLWCDELSVEMTPGKLVLVRFGWKFGGRGLVKYIAAKSVVDCPPAKNGEPSWTAAISTIKSMLPELALRKSVASIILSNHFVHYTLVPWSDTLNSAAEEQAYARHCFKQLYGADADNWELRLSPDRVEQPQIASAVDKQLLASLHDAFAQNGIKIKSIKPRLMAAYNNCRHALNSSSGWFALYEVGSLCLALLQDGNWCSVRTFRTGQDWRNTLLLLLERESFLSESALESNTVYLWAPELDAAALPKFDKWQIHILNPEVQPAFVQEYEGRFALAMGR